jgi:hypothetical protein
MSAVRVYVPSSLRLQAQLLRSGGVGPVPLLGHAVTDALRAAFPEGDEEEWEYAAMTAAAQDSLGLLGAEDVPRRVVVAVDAEDALPVEGHEPTLVEVPSVVPLRRLAAVHVDSEDAEDAVCAAREAWPDAEAGDVDAARFLERCLDHELGWYAAQEIGALVGQ